MFWASNFSYEPCIVIAVSEDLAVDFLISIIRSILLKDISVDSVYYCQTDNVRGEK